MNKKILFSLALAVVLIGGTIGTASAECGFCGISWPSCFSLCNIHLPTCFTCAAPARDLDVGYGVRGDLYMDRDLDKGSYIGGNPGGFTNQPIMSRDLDRDLDREAFIGMAPGPYPFRYDYNVRHGLTNDFGQDKTERGVVLY